MSSAKACRSARSVELLRRSSIPGVSFDIGHRVNFSVIQVRVRRRMMCDFVARESAATIFGPAFGLQLRSTETKSEAPLHTWRVSAS